MWVSSRERSCLGVTPTPPSASPCLARCLPLPLPRVGKCHQYWNISGWKHWRFQEGRIVGKTRLCYFSSWPCKYFFASRRTKYALNTYASKLSTITPPVTCFLSKFQYVMYSALSRAIFAYCLYQFVTCFCGISFYKCLSVNYIIFDKNEKLDQVYFNSSVWNIWHFPTLPLPSLPPAPTNVHFTGPRFQRHIAVMQNQGN